MLSAARYLWDRLSGPRTRADELLRLRRRLAEAADPNASATERRLARQLCQLRQSLGTQIGEVQACRGCVRPHSERWPGGHCCSGHTEDLFTDHELATLRLSGTSPHQLRPPRSEHAGCAFRGPTGCSLDTAHRPNLCVSYTCRELRSELDQRGDGAAIARLQQRIQVTFARFVATMQERLEAERFEELEDSLRRLGTGRHRRASATL